MSPLSALEGKFLPYRIVPSWLGAERTADLLRYAISAEARFEPARVTLSTVDTLEPKLRRARVLGDLGSFADILEEKALALQSDLEKSFGMGHRPTTTTQIDLVAHGDGCFFHPHIDTATDDDYVPGKSRRLSLVYYLHRQPRRFEGGRLRLFDLVGKQTIDVEPEHDSLVAFPSIALHEVQPVSCPGGVFADSRFSVNIWLSG
jgi:SM-20-related protein